MEADKIMKTFCFASECKTAIYAEGGTLLYDGLGLN